jgi:hypothetical protein
MKLSFFVGAAIGYVLGARAGHERYEAIVRAARKIVGSQTVQSTAGVLQAQVDELKNRAKGAVNNKLHAGAPQQSVTVNGGDGHRTS